MPESIHQTESPAHPSIPGEGLLHPAALAAIVVMLVNDHFLKARFGNFWTGKLSDIALLIFLPLLLQALWESAASLRDKNWTPSRHVLLTCIAISAITFTALQLVPAVDLTYEWVWGGLQWPFHRLAAALWDSPSFTAIRPVTHTADVTDLAALPFLWISYWIGQKDRKI